MMFLVTLLIHLLIACGFVWLVQVLLGAFQLRDPANKVIYVIAIVAAALWFLSKSGIAI